MDDSREAWPDGCPTYQFLYRRLESLKIFSVPLSFLLATLCPSMLVKFGLPGPGSRVSSHASELRTSDAVSIGGGKRLKVC